MLLETKNHKYQILNRKGIFYIDKHFDDYIQNKVTPSNVKFLKRKYALYKEFGIFSETPIEFTGLIRKERILDSLANTTNIIFELTQSCNLNCLYCCYSEFYEGNFTPRSNKKLDIKKAILLIKYIIELASKYKVRDLMPINLAFYGGEPLFEIKKIKSIIKYVNTKFKNQRFTYSITTNGTLINKYIDYLVKNDFRITISCDGNVIHNSYRVFMNNGETHSTIIKNLLQIKEEYPLFFNTNIAIHSVLHNRNSREEVLDYFKNTLNLTPSISNVSEVGLNNTLKDVFTPKKYNKISKINFGVRDVFLFLNRYTNRTHSNYFDFFAPNETNTFLPTGTCIPFSKRVFLTVDGNILQCEKVNNQLFLGNIEETVNVNFEKIEMEINLAYKKISKQCESCSNSWNCLVCIFHEGIFPTGECKFYKEFDKSEELINLITFLEKHPNKLSEIVNYYA